MKDLINKIKANKATAIIYTFSFVLIAFIIISVTYAYFEAQSLEAAIGNVNAEFSTLDEYLITTNGSLSMNVTPTTLPENGSNQEVSATAQVSLKRNPDTTNTATRTYYVYLRINKNTFTRTNSNKPEILLNAYLNNQEVTITDLTQVTEGTVTGYDITEETGVIPISVTTISNSSNDTATLHNWSFKITFLNLSTDQSANIGAILRTDLLILKDEYVGYTGTIYRNNTRTAFNNHTIEDEISNVWCVEDNGVPDCTYPYATQAYCEYWVDTCSEGTATLGVGSYETTPNSFRTRTYNVYCPIGEDNLTCGNNWYYDTEQDCLDNVDTSEYTCTPGSITKPFYLKHIVEENIIESTEACLWYNNHEFCLGPDYWVETGNGDEYHESAENGVATKNKLQTAMEAALGTQADSCEAFSNSAVCYFGDFSCSARAIGYVDCNDYGGCTVGDDGTSGCGWW